MNPDQRCGSKLMSRRTLFLVQVLELDSTTSSQAVTSALDPVQEPWIVLEAIVEPIVLGLESDQHTGWLSVAGNDDFPFSGLSKKSR